MFGTRGVRGTVGETVTAELAFDLGRALASAGYGRVFVGRDARDSGAILADAVSAGLRDCGADVRRAGVVATPTLARGVRALDAAVGVQVTASRGPPSENGFRLLGSAGQPFERDRYRSVARRIENAQFTERDWQSQGSELEPIDLVDRHVAAIRREVDLDADLSVVVDPANGPGRMVADALRECGCSVTTLNGQIDGRFPGRAADPTPDNCEVLRSTVAETAADFGVALDGDADRMLAVTEAGRFVPGDVLLALFGRRYAEEGCSVAAPVNASRAVDDALEAVGASVVRTRVGDGHVARRTREPDVAFGGDPRGAWIWPTRSLCPDGPLAACALAELVAARGPLADLVAAVDGYEMHRTTVDVADAEGTVADVTARLLREYDCVDTSDGARVETGDGWFLVRADGSDPLVHVTAETTDEARTARLARRAREFVERARSDPTRAVS